MASMQRVEASPVDGIDFCTLGMFIIDEIEFEAPNPPVNDIMGGAASFAAVGARLVAGREFSKSVAWILDAGSDFPPEIRETIQSWDTSCVIRETTDRLTTRGWNGYGPGDKRDFRYTTPKLRLNQDSLSDPLLLSSTFHIICSATRCIELVHGILRRRNALLQAQNINPATQSPDTRPIFVWEPVPPLCTPEELPNLYKAARFVDVLSPNALELAGYFGKKSWDGKKESDREMVNNIVSSGIGPEGTGLLVVRAGKDGSYTYCQERSLWLPAYHNADSTLVSPVIDPTGAGNCFLGGLAQGMVSEGRPTIEDTEYTLRKSEGWSDIANAWKGDRRPIPMALICATVAASYVVEQVGLPILSSSQEGEELWNGIGFSQRIRLYIKKMLETLEESTSKKDDSV